MEPRNVMILDRASNSLVPGTVRVAVASDKALLTRWHEEMPALAEDAEWDWDEVIDYPTLCPEEFEVFALEADSQLQGLRLLQIRGGRVDEYGVHGMRLATAPWNRPPKRSFSGVGSLLVGVAICRSRSHGHGGRMYCESLPGAVQFHLDNGFVEVGLDPVERLRRFHLSAAASDALLASIQEKGLLP